MPMVLVVVCKSQVASPSRLASPLFVASSSRLPSLLWHTMCAWCCRWVCSSVASVAMCGARSNLVLKLRRMT
eukprot:scaffold173614_cov35-Attheya_sp.AAC.1